LTGSGYLFGCIVSLLVHEAGHICVAHAFGIRIKRIGMNWRGPFIVRESGPPLPDLMVSAAGPLVNLIMAAMVWQIWPTVALANLVLGLSNLVPTRTSDGGRLLRGLTHAWSPAVVRMQAPTTSPMHE
jgi:Zn-dependent protease